MLTLQETQSIHDAMNRTKLNLLLILTFYIISQVSIFTWFSGYLNQIRLNRDIGIAKTPNFRA